MNLLTKMGLVGLPILVGLATFFTLRIPEVAENADVIIISTLGVLVGALISLIVRLVYEFHIVSAKLDAQSEVEKATKNDFYLSSSLAANVYDSVSSSSIDAEIFVALNNNIRRINQFDNKFSHYIFQNKISEANRQISDISRGFYQSPSEEEPTLNIKVLELEACKFYMKAVDYGDPEYWVSEQGKRYLESLAQLSKAGVTIERVFISDLPIDDRWQHVFDFHKKNKMPFCFVDSAQIAAKDRVNFVIYDGEILRDANLSIPTDGVGRPATFYFRNNENRHIFDERSELFTRLQSQASTLPS